MTKIINIESVEQFKKLIENSNQPVLVDFWATWCGPCRIMNPILQQTAETNNNITVAKVDVDQNPDLAGLYQVMSIPTILTFKNGDLTPAGNPIIGAVPQPMLQQYINEL